MKFHGGYLTTLKLILLDSKVCLLTLFLIVMCSIFDSMNLSGGFMSHVQEIKVDIV